MSDTEREMWEQEPISEAGRRERFAQWEKIGLERIKHDLLTGGYRVVGGPAQVVDLAWEWVKMKEAEGSGQKLTLKQPEHITLADGLRLLEEHLPTDEAKARLRQAFVRKAFRQEPLFAFEYDEADIDWATGTVKIPRKRERFCPVFRRADFLAYFFEVDDASAATREKQSELFTLKPSIYGVSVDLKEAARRLRNRVRKK